MKMILSPLLALVIAGIMLAAYGQGQSNEALVASKWVATAYCKGTHVATGIPVKRGMAASDPRHIPLGSVVRVSDSGEPKWDGVYWVVDTGPEIQGREIDLYMWSCYEALDFGRRAVQVEVIRRGWMPNGLVTK